MSKFKMNCGYCGKKCNMEEDFCVPQDSVYVCKSCYNRQQKVSDLEAKLAESESKIKVGEFWHSAYQGKQLDYDKMYAELRKSYDEVEQLKQQLAEKSQKIAELGDNYARLDEKYDYLQSMHEAVVEESLGYEKEIEQLKQHNQDKISFVVERLEKVKELILKECFEVSGKGVVVRYYTIYHIFDNQIKQLKGMK